MRGVINTYGGLTFTSESESVSKIPLLGDLPVLGFLFRSKAKDVSDRTLYVFITPRILRDPTFADLRLITRGPSEKMEIDLGGPPPLEPALMSIVETTAPFGSVSQVSYRPPSRISAPANGVVSILHGPGRWVITGS